MSAKYYSPPRDQLVSAIQDKPISAAFKTGSLAMAAIGMLVFAVGAVMGESRAWQAFHVNWLFFTTVATAGVMFAAVQRITTARWSRGIIRFLEGFVAFVPFAVVGLLLIIFVGRGHIYPWWDMVGTGELIPEKELYFGRAFFWARSILIFGGLALLQIWYVWTSVRLDVGITPEHGSSWAAGLRARMRNGFGEERRELHSTHSLQGKLAVIMTLVFGFGWCVLAWDHSMGMDIHFFSTMYGWQVFMGGWIGWLMVYAVLLRLWRNFLGAHDVITETHFWDVGKLCFAFTAFWGYLTFAQYLIIWYGNWGEETHFFRLRLIEPWTGLTVAIAVLMFVIPFFTLLSKSAKIHTPVMTVVSLCGIVGLWIHRYIEVYPSIYVTPDALPLGLWELMIFLGFGGLWAWSYMQFMDAFPRIGVVLLTSPYRDEVQVPCDPVTMEPLPAHE